MKTCTACGDPIEQYCEFPGPRGLIDLKCYSKLMANTPMPTAAQIVKMWSR